MSNVSRSLAVKLTVLVICVDLTGLIEYFDKKGP